MRAKRTLNILGISRTRLSNYVSQGIIRVEREGGHYLYNDEDVFALANRLKKPVKTAIYARVPKSYGIIDLNEQVKELKEYAKENNFEVNKIYKEKTGSRSLYEQDRLMELLLSVRTDHIKTVIVKNRTSLSPVAFDLIKFFLDSFDVKLIVAFPEEDEGLDINFESSYFLNKIDHIVCDTIDEARDKIHDEILNVAKHDDVIRNYLRELNESAKEDKGDDPE